MIMKHFLSGVLVAGALSACTPASAAEADGGAATEEQVRAWIGKLASDEFAVREEATEKLASCGPAAKKALEAAAESGDPEVRFRARTALHRMERCGNTPSEGGKGGSSVSVHAERSVSVEQGPQGIRIAVTEDRDGKSEKTVYEAADREAFKKKHPEVFEKYLGDGGLDAGGMRLFLDGPARALVLQDDGPEIDIDLGDLGIEELLEQQDQVMRNFRALRIPQQEPGPGLGKKKDGRRGLGIQIDGIPEALLAQLGIAGGALAADVEPASPAARAGLVRWDIITSFDGRKVASAEALRTAIREWPGYKPAAVGYIRGGQPREAQVSLDANAAGK